MMGRAAAHATGPRGPLHTRCIADTTRRGAKSEDTAAAAFQTQQVQVRQGPGPGPRPSWATAAKQPLPDPLVYLAACPGAASFLAAPLRRRSPGLFAHFAPALRLPGPGPAPPPPGSPARPVCAAAPGLAAPWALAGPAALWARPCFAAGSRRAALVALAALGLALALRVAPPGPPRRVPSGFGPGGLQPRGPWRPVGPPFVGPAPGAFWRASPACSRGPARAALVRVWAAALPVPLWLAGLLPCRPPAPAAPAGGSRVAPGLRPWGLPPPAHLRRASPCCPAASRSPVRRPPILPTGQGFASRRGPCPAALDSAGCNGRTAASRKQKGAINHVQKRPRDIS